MEIAEILFLLLFFVLPILQQLLGKRNTPEAPPPEPPPGPDPWDRSPVTTAERDLDEPLGLPAGWDWGTTAENGRFEEAPFEELPDEEAEERVLAQRRVRPVDEIPEAVRVADPVISLETLYVDRTVEHQRFHARAASPARPARPRQSRLATLLGGRSQLRRAVVLSEVLAPPRALRPPEG